MADHAKPGPGSPDRGSAGVAGKRAICPKCFGWTEAKDWPGLKPFMAEHARKCFAAKPDEMALSLTDRETGAEQGKQLRFTNGDHTIEDTGNKHPNPLKADLNRLIDKRQNLRRIGNYQEADKIRDRLKSLGIRLEDKPDGTSEWSQACR